MVYYNLSTNKPKAKLILPLALSLTIFQKGIKLWSKIKQLYKTVKNKIKIIKLLKKPILYCVNFVIIWKKTSKTSSNWNPKKCKIKKINQNKHKLV